MRVPLPGFGIQPGAVPQTRFCARADSSGWVSLTIRSPTMRFVNVRDTEMLSELGL